MSDPIQLDAGSVFYIKNRNRQSRLGRWNVEAGTPVDTILEKIHQEFEDAGFTPVYPAYNLPFLRESRIVNTHQQFAEGVDSELAAAKNRIISHEQYVSDRLNSYEQTINFLCRPNLSLDCAAELGITADSSLAQILTAFGNKLCQDVTSEDISITQEDSQTTAWNNSYNSTTKTYTLRSSVKIDPTPGNQLQATSNGLRVAVTVPNPPAAQTLAFNPDTRLLSISGGNSVSIPTRAPQTISFNPTNRVVSLSDGGGQFTLPTQDVTLPAHSVSVLETSTIAAASGQGANNHTLQLNVRIATAPSNRLSISPDGGLLVAGDTNLALSSPNDTLTINQSGTSNHTAQLDVKIMANTPGYANDLEGGIGGLRVNKINANNGLTLNAPSVATGGERVVELGGTLQKNTTINQGDYSVVWSRTNANPTTAATITQRVGLQITAGPNLAGNQFPVAAHYSSLDLVPGTDVGISGSSPVGAVIGALVQNYSNTAGKVTMGGSRPMAGVIGQLILTAPVGNTLSSFSASLLSRAPLQSGSGFLGTLPNFAGLYLEDSTLGAAGNIPALDRITTRYGIYQEGSTDVNRFFGPIQYSNTLTSVSDSRLKTNITPYTKGLDAIAPLQVSKYTMFGKERVGIIAQQLKTYIPEAVEFTSFKPSESEEAIQDLHTVNESVVLWTLVKAVQELQTSLTNHINNGN